MHQQSSVENSPLRTVAAPEVISRENAVPVVEKLPERMGTAFPLLKCLRKPPKCTKLQDFAYTISKFFRGRYPRSGWDSASAVLGPRRQFPFGSPAFSLFQFYETTTGPRARNPIRNSLRLLADFPDSVT